MSPDLVGEKEHIEKIASDSLARVTDFIKFAEAKHAAALTFSSAWILAVYSIIVNAKTAPAPLNQVMLYAALLFFFSVATSIASFIPRTDRTKFVRLKTSREGPNLLFFGDIAEMNLENFEIDFRARYKLSSTSQHDYISDLCDQVAINSQIANRKFKLFKWSLFFIAVALLLIGSATVRIACERLEVAACRSQI